MDVKYLEAKHNHLADWLSRRTPEALVGEAYKLEKGEENNVAKGETVDYANIKVAATSELLKITTISPAHLFSS